MILNNLQMTSTEIYDDNFGRQSCVLKEARILEVVKPDHQGGNNFH